MQGIGFETSTITFYRRNFVPVFDISWRVSRFLILKTSTISQKPVKTSTIKYYGRGFDPPPCNIFGFLCNKSSLQTSQLYKIVIINIIFPLLMFFFLFLLIRCVPLFRNAYLAESFCFPKKKNVGLNSPVAQNK